MFTIRQYLFSLNDPHALMRNLGEVTPLRNQRGEILFSVGNSAIVFPVLHEGKKKSLRGYFRKMPRLKEIYQEKFHPKSLYLYTSPTQGEWVDVVMDEWQEGKTLDEEIRSARKAMQDGRLSKLAMQFDQQAFEWLSMKGAHGDLKPENIIVTQENQLRLIDFDACFRPEFRNEKASELGTSAFQHPLRTADDFNEWLDDYPIALISTALHALSIHPLIAPLREEEDGLLYSPQQILSGRDKTYQTTLSLFERKGMATQYRIAKLLASPSYRLEDLPTWLHYQIMGQPQGGEGQSTCDNQAGQDLELFVEKGLWGYRHSQSHEIIIPPLYEEGFEFQEGLAAVRLGSTWHFINPRAESVLSCPEYTAVKPFRNGRCIVEKDGKRFEMNLQGKVFAI